MDNSFEEQFAQNLRTTSAQATKPISRPTSDSRLPLIISVILASIVLIESIALVITIVNYFDTFSSDTEGFVEEQEDPSVENFIISEDGHLVAFNSTCKNAETGAYYTFSTNNSFREYSATGSLSSSGTYSIVRDSIVKFNTSSGSKDNLIYDGYILTDGNIIYDCEEPAIETTTETK